MGKLLVWIMILGSVASSVAAQKRSDPFFFIQLSDPQLGFIDDNRSYARETELMELFTDAINRLRPAFVVVTGDMVHDLNDAGQVADGGTRCASITGAWIALRDAVDWMLAKGMISEDPILAQVSAVSVGMWSGEPVLDLNYAEDSASDTDMNVVMTSAGKYVEIQGTAEGDPFSEGDLAKLLALAKKGNAELAAFQRKALTEKAEAKQ